MEWFTKANCKGQTALFFAPHNERSAARERREAAAVALCKVCPVATDCAQYAAAIGEQQGIWGGVVLS